MISDLVSTYLSSISGARSPKTVDTYSLGLRAFVRVVGDEAPINVDTYIRFLQGSKEMTSPTQATYRAAINGFYLFCAERGVAVNLAAMKSATQRYGKRQGPRLLNFNRRAIEQVLSYAETLTGELQDLRDRAFVLTLADTGLRISEACALKRGDIDWEDGRSLVIGKGDKQAVVRYSQRSLGAIRLYLQARAELDGGSGKPLVSLPVFARHDKGAGHKVKSVASGGMWFAMKALILAAGVDPNEIRVHDFRHYFVTTIYLATNDLKTAQEMARHSSITTTNRYAHLGGKTDQIYNNIFNKS